MFRVYVHLRFFFPKHFLSTHASAGVQARTATYVVMEPSTSLDGTQNLFMHGRCSYAPVSPPFRLRLTSSRPLPTFIPCVMLYLAHTVFTYSPLSDVQSYSCVETKVVLGSTILLEISDEENQNARKLRPRSTAPPAVTGGMTLVIVRGNAPVDSLVSCCPMYASGQSDYTWVRFLQALANTRAPHLSVKIDCCEYPLDHFVTRWQQREKPTTGTVSC